MSVLNSFDRIAPVYDRLAGLVFGTAISDAQRTHLGALTDAREILILGGGTGWILQDLLHVNAKATITYVEASQRMIELSRRRIPDAEMHRLKFIHGTEEGISDQGQFDAIVINFFADMFEAAELIKVAKRLNAVSRPKGRLLCTDFVDDTVWQRMLLRMMYGFFRLTTGLTNQRLAPWQRIIRQEGFQQIGSGGFWNGFIRSELYEKIS